MNDFNHINEVVAPYYEQFQKLGALYDEESILFRTYKSGEKFFASILFYELKRMAKIKKRRIKRDYRDTKRQDRRERTQMLLKDFRAYKALVKARKLKDKEAARDAANLRKVLRQELRNERKAAKAQKSAVIESENLSGAAEVNTHDNVN